MRTKIKMKIILLRGLSGRVAKRSMTTDRGGGSDAATWRVTIK